MLCPNCYSYNVAVRETRDTDDERAVTRRRKCLDCGCTFRTMETLAWIIKMGAQEKEGSEA